MEREKQLMFDQAKGLSNLFKQGAHQWVFIFLLTLDAERKHHHAVSVPLE